MFVCNKSNVSLVIGCLFSFSVLFIGCINLAHGDSTPVEQGAEQSGRSVVKIPPPIEGIVLDRYKEPHVLEKADITILSGGGVRHDFSVELARTEQEQRTGMMYRRHIAKGTGMLFLFNGSRERNFWMKNTLVSLDLLFIRNDGVIHHIHPLAEVNSLKRISSNGAVSAVLEIGGGETESLGLYVGDRILYEGFADANVD